MLNFHFGRKKRPYVLVILDGWGIAPVWGGNAISIADNRTFTKLFKDFPSTILSASGPEVGLPEGAPGNSEAGHLNIGAGEIVYQDQPIIDEEIQKGTFFSNKILLEAIGHAKEKKSNIHLMGLLSKTGTHSQIKHLFALLDLISKNDFRDVYIHLFTDGRDSDSMSGIEMLSEVENACAKYSTGRVVSLIGRFYAMDRDNRWDRIKKTYQLLTEGLGHKFESTGAIFTASYARGVTDEFIEPSIIVNKSNPFMPIKDHDSVIFFNFRADRAKELTKAFLAESLPEYPERKKMADLYFATFVMHDDNSLAKHAFYPKQVENTLSQIWSEAKLRQFHLAETEKFAHVTYFLNGGREKPFPGEDRLMIPSPTSVATYDKMPEMHAQKVTDAAISALKKNIYDCMVINFANPDMVGHTGDLNAAVKAVEYIDQCLSLLTDEVLDRNGVVFVCADHGNAEQMVNPKTGAPDTEHSSNPVPFIIVAKDSALAKIKLVKGGKLASIAPTILKVMNIPFDFPNKEKSLIEERSDGR